MCFFRSFPFSSPLPHPPHLLFFSFTFSVLLSFGHPFQRTQQRQQQNERTNEVGIHVEYQILAFIQGIVSDTRPIRVCVCAVRVWPEIESKMSQDTKRFKVDADFSLTKHLSLFFMVRMLKMI